MNLFGKSPDQKYADYLSWFETQVANPDNWDWLRADRDCANWAYLEKPEPYGRGEALLMMSDPKAMAKAMSHKLEVNHQKYNEMSKYINGDPKQGLISPEYVARFENTKKLRELLTKYTGSAEFASDELFRLKQLADKEGKDFAVVAEREILATVGKNEEPKSEPLPEQLFTPEEAALIPNFFERIAAVFKPKQYFGPTEATKSYNQIQEQRRRERNGTNR